MFILWLLLGFVGGVVVCYLVGRNNKDKALQVLGIDLKAVVHEAINDVDDLSDEMKVKVMTYVEKKFNDFMNKLKG